MFYENKQLLCNIGNDVYTFIPNMPVYDFWKFIENSRNHLAFFGLTASIEIHLNNRLRIHVNGYEINSTSNYKLIISQERISIRLQDGSVVTPSLVSEVKQKNYKVLIDLDTTDNLSGTEMNDIFEEFLSQKEIKEKFEKFINSAYTGLTTECEIHTFELLDISEKDE